ncbi:MAG: hypothetical protein LC099_10565 [Anaerolineales bacterium]|nr:hypothetical protein [Anaerolineales bacterium]
MKDDVRKYIYGTLIIFPMGLLTWGLIVYLSSCGFSFACERARTLPEMTSVPTLIPATMPVATVEPPHLVVPTDKCRVSGVNLIGAWVSAGSPETDAFPFADADGAKCEATYADVQSLFARSNIWYAGSLSCVFCHSDLAVSPAQLDLSSYEGVLAGSRRADNASKGTDILGGGNWESSLLYQYIAKTQPEVAGHDATLDSNMMIYAGSPIK